ncbi:MAG: SusE domain-containing protein [Mucilaginibacter sp.]
MKRSKYIIILALFALFGCKKNNIVAVTSDNPAAPSVSVPAEASSVVLTNDDAGSKFFIRWKKADYGVSTVLNYTVEIDAAGKSFSTLVSLGTTTDDSLSITKGALNDILITTLGLPQNAASQVEIRVKTVLNKDTITSKPVKISVTTYKPPVAERLKLSVPGAYQGWNPGAAPVIYNIEGSKYEGYVFMGSAGEFKFTSAPDWDHINYGSESAGTLTTDGTKGGIVVGAAGYYKFNVDVNALTYSYTLVQSFGIIGSATAGVWDNSTPMTYSEATGLWTVTADLVAGAVKFRANNNWDLNYGPAVTSDFTGRLVQTNDAITINDAGNYTITIDMRQTTPDSYTYKVVKN